MNLLESCGEIESSGLDGEIQYEIGVRGRITMCLYIRILP